MAEPTLTDKGLSIFAFAAYHSLLSGEPVAKVVLNDGQGHQADSHGVEELTAAGLITADGDRGTFTGEGSAVLAKLLDAMRASV